MPCKGLHVLPQETEISKEEKKGGFAIAYELGFGKRKLIDKIITSNWEVARPEQKTFTYTEMLYTIQEMLNQEGKQYQEGESLLRGHALFRDFVKHLLYRNLANYDSMILLTGTKGTGKSSQAIIIAREWCKLQGIKFNPDRHIAYSNADVMRKIDTLNKFEPLICLSGETRIKIFSNRGMKRIPIRNLEDKKNFLIYTYNEKTKMQELKLAKKCIKTGVGVVYELLIEDGTTIRATENHLFLTTEGYKKLCDLTQEDGLVVENNYLKMIGIRSIGKEEVYDIVGVDDNHNFVANGIVVHNCDEAVNFASSADWALKANRELRKRLAVVRTKHLLFILCFPMKIYKLEKTYLESFCEYWCDIIARGVMAVYVKDRNPVIDSWRMKDFGLIGSYTEFTDINKIKDKLKQHPNFWQILKIPKPPDWLYKKYLRVREKNVYDNEDILASVSKEDINNALLILSLRDIMATDTTLTMNRIILHVRNQYDTYLSKQVVQAAIDDAQQLVNKLREKAIGYDDAKTGKSAE